MPLWDVARYALHTRTSCVHLMPRLDPLELRARTAVCGAAGRSQAAHILVHMSVSLLVNESHSHTASPSSVARSLSARRWGRSGSPCLCRHVSGAHVQKLIGILGQEDHGALVGCQHLIRVVDSIGDGGISSCFGLFGSGHAAAEDGCDGLLWRQRFREWGVCNHVRTGFCSVARKYAMGTTATSVCGRVSHHRAHGRASERIGSAHNLLKQVRCA